MKSLLLVGLLIMPFAAFAQTPSAIPDDHSIKASALWSAYERNEVAADKNFKGKEITIKGTVVSIGKWIISGTPYVGLAGGPYAQEYMHEVVCFFPGDGSELEKLSKGQKVIIQGTGEGKQMLNVMVQDCKLQSSK